MESDTGREHTRRSSGRERGSRRERERDDSDRRRDKDAHRHRSRRDETRRRDGDERRGGDERSRSPDTGRSRDGGDGRERSRRNDRERHSRRRSPRRSPRSPSHAHDPVKKRGPLPDQADSFALVQQGGDGDDAPVQPPKETPNYGTSGALAAASNAVTQADGSVITLKYHEPPEGRRPPASEAWRLFVFKDGAIVDTVPLSARSCWLVGREAAVADLLAAHPSVSKQHAILQFRYTERRNEYGDRLGRVRPYLLDLASANGTQLNGEAVAAQRFIELRERDMVQFGESTREYVLMKGDA